MKFASVTRNKFWLGVTLLLLTSLAYSNSFATGFTLDSAFLILKDPRIVQATAANFQQILTQDYWFPSFHSGLFRPLTTASFLFNFAILGDTDHAFGYHEINLLFHSINVCLLFLLASRLFDRAWPAFFAAALWAVHPIATEAVTNLVGRSDELAAMAIFGALLLYQRSVKFTGRRRALAAVALFFIAVLGGMAKELTAVLIAVMLLWDLVRGIGTWREWLQTRWTFYLAVALALGVFLGARHLVIGGGPPAEFPYVDNPLVYAPFWIAKLTALKVICLDLWLMVFPVQLSADRSYNQIPLTGWNDPAAYAALLLIGSLLAVAILRRRKDPLMFWCAGFFALTLLPVSNLLVTIGSIMAERFLYLPSAAFAIAVTALAFRSRWKDYAPVFLCVIVVLFAVRTYLRNPDWTSDFTLSSHDAAVVPQSFKMHYILARTLLQQGAAHIDDAIHEAELSWDIDRRLPPQYVFTQPPTSLGIYYRIKGDLSGGPNSLAGRSWYLKSLAVLQEAQKDSLTIGDAYDDLQELHGQPRQVRLEQAEVYLNLGLTQAGLGQREQARDAYIYGRKLAPTNPDFYDALAMNYLAAGNRPWAAIAAEEKLILDGPKPQTVQALEAIMAALPGGDCALAMEGGATKLNIGCAAVNICAVWADLGQTYYQARLRTDAYTIKRDAIANGCSAKLLDAAIP